MQKQYTTLFFKGGYVKREEDTNEKVKPKICIRVILNKNIIMASLILAIIKIPMENDYKPNYLGCISSYNPNTQRKTCRLGFAFLYNDI